MRVLMADSLDAAVAVGLAADGFLVRHATRGGAISDEIASFDPEVVVVRSTRIGALEILAGTSLSLVVRAGAGTDTIDLDAASARGITVANCPGRNAVAVAELAMAVLLAADRRIVDAAVSMRAGRWEKKEFGQARGLWGRTLAVLGVGTVGREVIRRANAFGMRVRAWSRSLTEEGARACGAEFATSAMEACGGADAVSVHLALTSETRGLVDRAILEALAPGAIVVDTSRGGVVDATALADAVRSRGLRAGIDVWTGEPSTGSAEFGSPLLALPGVYGTPHIGASTAQAEESVGTEVLRIVRSWRRTGHAPNCVNLAVRTPATHLLLVRHADRVGVLAGVLDLLREAGVNVQEMENSVFRGASAAAARIQIDAAPSDDVLNRICRSADIFAATVVKLED